MVDNNDVQVHVEDGTSSLQTARDQVPAPSARANVRRAMLSKKRAGSKLPIIFALSFAFVAAAIAAVGLILAIQGGENLEISSQFHKQLSDDLNSSLLLEAQNRQEHLRQESSSRIAQDRSLNASLQQEAETRGHALFTEKTERDHQISQLNATLGSEADERRARDQSLGTTLQAEALERKAESDVLNNTLQLSLADKNSRLHQLECRLASCSSHGTCNADFTSCTCDSGFTGSDCSECISGYFGAACVPCKTNCGDHGRCDDGASGSGVCICDSGWRGLDCTLCAQHFYGPSCDPCISCGSNGLCMDGISGTGSCACLDGWRGANCSECAGGYYGPTCEPCSCSGRGTCDDGKDGTGCVCDAGWTGSRCQACAEGYFGSSCTVCPSCPSNAFCSEGLTGNGSCVCNPGFQAPSCVSCLPAHFGASCSPCPDCGDHGSCSDGMAGDGQCVCDSNWAGDVCDDCDGDRYGPSCDPCPNCSSNGQCNATTSGDGTYVCNEGATGSLCENCESGYFGASCSSCPSCVNGVCSEGRNGTGACMCIVGWSGALCDECAPDYYGATCVACPACGSHSSCVDGLNGTGTCACDLGWEGALCDTCSPGYFGPSCSACPNCGVNGECVDGLTGNGTCTCNEGWAGSLCDECSSNYFGATCSPCSTCIENAECLDGLQGNGSCVCSSGWAGAYCNITLELGIDIFVQTQPVFLQLGGTEVLDHVVVSSNFQVIAASNSADDTMGTGSGAILVWERQDLSSSLSSVTPVKLTDPDGESKDYLGSGRIAISSDGLVLAAGSYGDDDMGSSSGSVLVWQREDLSTSLDAVTPVKLVDPDGAGSDYLGRYGVALSSDGLVLAAASYRDSGVGGSNSGSVLVWQRADLSSNLSTVVPLKLFDPDGASSDFMGYGGVALSSDGLVLASSSYFDDDMGSGSGSVLVWQRADLSTNLSTVTPVKLIDPNGASSDYLGKGGVALSSDGLVLAAASEQDDEMGNDSGSVLVWLRADMSASFADHAPVKLLDPEGKTDDKLGTTGVSVTKTAEGKAVVAAIGGSYVTLFVQVSSRAFEAVRLVNSYLMNTVSLSTNATLVFGTATTGVHQGLSYFEQVCASGWAGASCDTCQPGFFGSDCAPCQCQYGFCNDGLAGDGTCSCLFSTGARCESLQFATAPDPTGAVDDQLGSGGLAFSSDGLTLAATSHVSDDMGANSGSLRVWQRSDLSTDLSTVTPVKLIDPDGSAGDLLGLGGVALSSNGLVVAAGSYADTIMGTQSGSISVWQRADITTSLDTVTPVKLTDPDGAAYDSLGFGGVALSSDGLVLAASSYLDDGGGTKRGSVLVWQRADLSTNLSTVTPVKLIDPDGADTDYLGYGGVCLSSDGLVLVSTSYHDDDMGFNSGSVLVWQRADLSTSFGTTTPVKLNDPDGASNDKLGYGGAALSSDGLVLAAASYGDSDTGSASGSVLVWQRADQSTSFSAVTPVKLIDPFGGESDNLGQGGVALSADGLVLATAAHLDDEMGMNSGSILVWKRADLSTSFSAVTPLKLIYPDGQAEDLFGKGGVALSSDGSILASALSRSGVGGRVIVFNN